MHFLIDRLASLSPKGVMVMIDEFDRPIYDNPNVDEWEKMTELIANFVRIFKVPNVQMLLLFGRYRFPVERIAFSGELFQIGVEDDPLETLNDGKEEGEFLCDQGGDNLIFKT